MTRFRTESRVWRTQENGGVRIKRKREVQIILDEIARAGYEVEDPMRTAVKEGLKKIRCEKYEERWRKSQTEQERKTALREYVFESIQEFGPDITLPEIVEGYRKVAPDYARQLEKVLGLPDGGGV